MTIAEMTAYYALQGKSLADKLSELYEKYGYYKTAFLFHFEILRFLIFVLEKIAIGQISAPNRKSPTAR